MKEFKLGWFGMYLIYALILLLVPIFYTMPNCKFSINLLIPCLIFFIFEVYLFSFLFAIHKDEFKKIIVNKTAGKFLLITSKNETLSLPFEAVAAVNMAKGQVIRGFVVGHVTIITRDGRLYGVTISNIDKFSVEIPRDIEITFDKAIFYNPKWNNLDREIDW